MTPDAKSICMRAQLDAMPLATPKTAEQRARNMLTRMGIEGAQHFSAGELVELANLIAHRPVITKEMIERERARFEQYYRASRAGKGRKHTEGLLDLQPSGDYLHDATQRHWWTWQNAVGLA